MRKAVIYVHDKKARVLSENNYNSFHFVYDDNYDGDSVSLTMPKTQKEYVYTKFPSFFEGLLPEGIMLDGMKEKYLKLMKTDGIDFNNLEDED